MTSKIVKGVEADRSKLRGMALRVIRYMEDFPKMKLTDVRRDWLAPPPLSSFRRLEPIGFDFEEDDDWWIFAPKDCTPDLVWPLDVSVVADRSTALGYSCECPLAIGHTYTITAKQARGYAGRFSPFMVRHDVAQVERSKMITAAGIYAWLGGKWADAQNRVIRWTGTADNPIPMKGAATSEDEALQPALMTSIALRQRYEWAVALGIEGSPTVRFKTDPTGIKDVFAIRDLPEGKDRRDALMTWIGDHWRQDRRDPEVERYVRSHLRGATAFTWRGMQCELIPSQYDIERRDRLAEDRQRMKVAGQDVRKRDGNIRLTRTTVP